MSSSDSNGDGPREHAQNRTKEHFAKKSNKSDGGFFQTPPRLENQFLADTVFQRIVDRASTPFPHSPNR